MSEDLFELRVSEHARIPYSSLGPEDRRLVDGWFDHLRNWRNDQFIRSHSRRLDANEELYAFQTSTDLVINFRIDDAVVTVLSIFRRDALRSFAGKAERISL